MHLGLGRAIDTQTLRVLVCCRSAEDAWRAFDKVWFGIKVMDRSATPFFSCLILCFVI